VARSGRAARRAATPKLRLDFGKCDTCKKTIGNPLTHTCTPKSDFKSRKRTAEQQAKAKGKRQPDRHDYQDCKDDNCKRSACVAYKTGYRRGYDDGFDDGYGIGWANGHAAGKAEGYEQGFAEGLASCPGPHGG
jgi:hypothetical protein